MNAQTERLSLTGPAGAIEVARDAAAAGVASRGVGVAAAAFCSAVPGSGLGNSPEIGCEGKEH